MNQEITLIFPNQLFEKHPAIRQDRKIILIEDSLFFKDKKYPFNFHKKKLIFHRASMKAYKHNLDLKGNEVEYFEHINIEEQDNKTGSMQVIFDKLHESQVEKVHFTDPTDWAIEKRLELLSKKFGIALIQYDSPNFLCSREYIQAYFKNKKKYSQTSFYIAQRKRLKILLTQGKPRGGKWTYDTQNRKKIPKSVKIPKITEVKPNEYVKEAISYIEQRFSQNIGQIANFFYPVTHISAQKWYQQFLDERFKDFGPYEDAIKQSNPYLFHSIISPLINIGLLNPQKVVEQALSHAKENQIPLNSLEGFVRQIIGWREFLRAIYIREGVKQRTSNFWENTHPIPDTLYKATTGILPIDNTIKQLKKNAYAHHIERLMILGNFMNLCEIDPDDVYTWFMEMFIDAYDWVMVPNVYGMSLNADGGLITTKPYISSSNYILKMSDYKKGEWCDIWNGLYWRFINKHQDIIKKNPRMGMMVNVMNRMNKDKLKQHLEVAGDFFKKFHNQ
jgi:deoxyribodipyrimidine photolyase-related protein